MRSNLTYPTMLEIVSLRFWPVVTVIFIAKFVKAIASGNSISYISLNAREICNVPRYVSIKSMPHFFDNGAISLNTLPKFSAAKAGPIKTASISKSLISLKAFATPPKTPLIN